MASFPPITRPEARLAGFEQASLLVVDLPTLWLKATRKTLAGLNDSATIQNGKTDLKQNHRKCSSANPLNNAENVTEEKQPESLLALPCPLRRHHPGGATVTTIAGH